MKLLFVLSCLHSLAMAGPNVTGAWYNFRRSLLPCENPLPWDGTQTCSLPPAFRTTADDIDAPVQGLNITSYLPLLSCFPTSYFSITKRSDFSDWQSMGMMANMGNYMNSTTVQPLICVQKVNGRYVAQCLVTTGQLIQPNNWNQSNNTLEVYGQTAKFALQILRTDMTVKANFTYGNNCRNIRANNASFVYQLSAETMFPGYINQVSMTSNMAGGPGGKSVVFFVAGVQKPKEGRFMSMGVIRDLTKPSEAADCGLGLIVTYNSMFYEQNITNYVRDYFGGVVNKTFIENCLDEANKCSIPN